MADIEITGLAVASVVNDADLVYLRQAGVDKQGTAALMRAGYLAIANNLSDLASAATARANLGLGTAATTSASAYATAAQGTTADNAVPKSTATTKGDLLAATGASVLARLGVGTNGQILTADSTQATGIKWATGGAGSVATDIIFDAIGDIPVGTGPDTAVKLPVGAAGQLLHPLSTAATGLSWAYNSKMGFASASQYGKALYQTDGTNQAAARAQVCCWYPCYTDRAITLDGIKTYCWTLEAGSTLRFGVYNTSSNMVPVNLLADYGTVSGASTGLKEATGTTVVPPGIFWLAVWQSNHSTVRWMKPNQYDGALGNNVANGQLYIAWEVSAVDYSAGLPSTAPALTIVTGSTNNPTAYYRFT